ncbi:MAG: glycosyltransferase family 4 protein, partial [Enterovibrio sp.]
MQKNNVDQNALADQPSYFASDDLKNASAAKIAILFVHYGDARLRGSERCLLNLIANLDKNRFSPIVWCNSENLAQQCNNLAIPAYVDHFALFFDPPKSNATLKTFSGLITRAIELINLHHVQLIHANNGAPSQWLIWAARKAKLPLLQHLHACYPFYQRLGFAFYHTSMTICVSRAVQKQLLDDGCEPRRCQVVVNGADVDALLAQQVVDLRQFLHLPASAFIAVTVGELVYAKGVDLLLEASFSLRKKGFSLELVVIGDGELRGELQAQAAELGLQTHVHFLGQQPAVIGLLRGGADLYVSGTREESFGLSLLEASIAKLAVVAPLVGGISDVIEHEKTGILVEPNSSAAIADAISELYNDKTRRTALGEQGFKSALEK